MNRRCFLKIAGVSVIAGVSGVHANRVREATETHDPPSQYNILVEVDSMRVKYHADPLSFMTEKVIREVKVQLRIARDVGLCINKVTADDLGEMLVPDDNGGDMIAFVWRLTFDVDISIPKQPLMGSVLFECPRGPSKIRYDLRKDCPCELETVKGAVSWQRKRKM